MSPPHFSIAWAGIRLWTQDGGFWFWLFRNMARFRAGASSSGYLVGGGVTGGRSDEIFDRGDWLDAAACADPHAIEGGSGAGKVELPLQGPALEKRIDEAGVKNVAGTGGVDDIDLIGRGVMKTFAVPGEHAFMAEGGGGQAKAIFCGQRGQRLAQVGISCEADRNVS